MSTPHLHPNPIPADPLVWLPVGLPDPHIAVLSQVSAVAAMLAVGLPFALALQPLQMEIDVTSLEHEFHHVKTKDGTPVTYVYASKGM